MSLDGAIDSRPARLGAVELSEDQQLRLVADLAIDGLLICRNGIVSVANAAFDRLYDGAGRDVTGLHIADILTRCAGIAAGMEANASLICAGASEVPVQVSSKLINVCGREYLAVAVRDRRDMIRSERRILRLAHQDSLTGLANRRSFSETLAGCCLLPRGDDAFALIMLDLDRFKVVNDTLGHGTGDELLQRVAQRLKRAVRENDLVARLGGDEFAMIVSSGGTVSTLRRIASDIIDLIGRPFIIGGQIVEMNASAGIAFAPSDADEPRELSRCADLALYQAKHRGGHGYCFYDAAMSEAIKARRQLEFDLRAAVSNNEFELVYQPQVDARSGRFDGAEALIRWRHPSRGLVSPAQFIPLAEELGLIHVISTWVLRTACTEAKAWPSDLTVAVNLSPVQFKTNHLAEDIAGILAETGFPATRLELEITESTLLQDSGNTLGTLHALRDIGIRISMDDFGTGYSSLSYLRRFPFNKIKIDQSFIKQIPEDVDSVIIVRAIASLGAQLGMRITAEGVETAAQLAVTTAEGCDQLQGYFISRPVPAEDLRRIFTVTPMHDKFSAW